MRIPMSTMPAMVSGLCAVAPASPAFAQPLTGLFSWQVSADGGATWTQAITVNSGAAYRIRAVANWTDGATSSVGFAGCTFEQIDLIGADASDIFGGASGPGGVPTYLTRRQGVAENWSLQAGTGASATGLKLDNIVASPGRVNLNQLPYRVGGSEFPNPMFTRANPVVMFDMAAVAGAAKTLTITATWLRLGAPASNEFKVYTTEAGENKKPTQQADLTPAVITIIPAPATPAMLSMAALAAVRRRSR